MKLNTKLRLAAISLASILLVGGVNVAQAASSQLPIFRDPGIKKRRQVPEGSSGIILAVAAGAMGAGLLVRRRKEHGSLA